MLTCPAKVVLKSGIESRGRLARFLICRKDVSNFKKTSWHGRAHHMREIYVTIYERMCLQEPVRFCLKCVGAAVKERKLGASGSPKDNEEGKELHERCRRQS
jgi:hypothetical protein